MAVHRKRGRFGASCPGPIVADVSVPEGPAAATHDGRAHGDRKPLARGDERETDSADTGSQERIGDAAPTTPATPLPIVPSSTTATASTPHSSQPRNRDAAVTPDNAAARCSPFVPSWTLRLVSWSSQRPISWRYPRYTRRYPSYSGRPGRVRDQRGWRWCGPETPTPRALLGGGRTCVFAWWIWIPEDRILTSSRNVHNGPYKAASRLSC
jgi:hypothetical protein